MKALIAFILTYLGWWFLITAIGWFTNPEVVFRVMAGDTVVVVVSIFTGWIPAVYVAVCFGNSKD